MLASANRNPHRDEVGRVFDEVSKTAEIWRIKYDGLLTQYRLLEASFHSYRTNHSVSTDPYDLHYKCRDCGWKGRAQ